MQRALIATKTYFIMSDFIVKKTEKVLNIWIVLINNDTIIFLILKKKMN